MAYWEGDVLYVDNTTLTTFAQCETRAFMKYGHNLRPQRDVNLPMLAGIAIHKAIEAHYKGMSEQVVMNTLEVEYGGTAMRHASPEDRLGMKNVSQVVRGWIARHPVNKLPYQIISPDMIEVPFDIELPGTNGKIHYVGRIDAHVTQRGSNRQDLMVLDNKSTGRVDNKFRNQFTLGSQMAGYIWATQQLYPTHKVLGYCINVIEVSMVPSSGSQCRLHQMPYHECGLLHPQHGLMGPVFVHPHLIDAWLVNAVKLATKWRNLLLEYGGDVGDVAHVAMDGRFRYQACALCEFREFCLSGRDVDSTAFPMVREEWIPGDLALRAGGNESQ